jgi:hypothetical protein
MNYSSKSALPNHAPIKKCADRRSAINVLVITKSIRRIIKLKLVENNYSIYSHIFARGLSRGPICYQCHDVTYERGEVARYVDLHEVPNAVYPSHDDSDIEEAVIYT